MKFVCTQKNLVTGLIAVSPLASRNPQLPVLQYVLLEVVESMLHCSCTDLEIGARVVVAGKAEKAGSCTIPARRLLDYVQQLPDSSPLTLTLQGQQLLIATEGYSARFPAAAADDFPLLPARPGTAPVVLEGRSLGVALTHTLFAAARDESRPELRGILVRGGEDEVRVAATDSFRLAEYVLPAAGVSEFQVLLPLSAAQEIVRLFNEAETLSFFMGDNHMTVQVGEAVLSSRLIDGSFPDYRQIIPQSTSLHGVVKREEFLRALRVLNVFLPRDSRRVTVQARPEAGEIVLRVVGGESGEGEVKVAFQGTGGELEALYNITYLLEGVTHVLSEECELRCNGASDPIMVVPGGQQGRYVYLVMPIQV